MEVERGGAFVALWVMDMEGDAPALCALLALRCPLPAGQIGATPQVILLGAPRGHVGV